MRMDLERGRVRRSTTATEAAEIDFMNIKQQGVDSRDRAATVNTGTLRKKCALVGEPKNILLLYLYGSEI